MAHGKRTVFIPQDTIPVIDNERNDTGQTLLLFRGLILKMINAFTQTTRAQSRLVWQINEKLKDIQPGLLSIELDEDEHDFLVNTFQNAMKQGRIIGPEWYPVLCSIEDAELVKKAVVN